MKKKPHVKFREVNGSINLTLGFRACRIRQKKGKATWKLIDCEMMLPFKVQIGDMAIQPKLICKVVLHGRGESARLHLARQAAKAALSGEVQAP